MTSNSCFVILKNLEDEKEISIFLGKEDFEIFEEINDTENYSSFLCNILLIFLVNYEKLSENYKKEVIFKLSCFIRKMNETLQCSLNLVEFVFYKNKVKINYNFSSTKYLQ